jgi:cytochrome c2
VTLRKTARWLLVLGAFAGPALSPAAENADSRSPEVARAVYLWSKSPHGPMLERILPPSVEPRELPEPASEGARLATRYCVQCHYLPSPQMHTPKKWNTIVVRMVWRMQGKGNMGALMKDMMDNVEAPADAEAATLSRYLQKHGQKEMDPAHPALKTEAGKMFSIACTQCHALPDPQRHTAAEWPAVVQRMRRHITWANTVEGPDSLRTTPVLDTREIVRFLQRHARAE